jgi:hypothetical protein
MQLCDELGEEALAEITPKLLRRKLEEHLDRPEGDLDVWKQSIIEWYDFGEQIKKALRTFLEKLDENAAPTETIQRELEHQLHLDESELDTWKAEIERWTGARNPASSAESEVNSENGGKRKREVCKPTY